MLLSIIIPTKNRQDTALFAIDSVMAIPHDDVEVIVQDCSDTGILKEQILERFGSDLRIKYFYSDDKPSMTDNWNRGLENATGEYLCGIGDDDAVLTEIYTVAQWAKTQSAEAITHSAAYYYTWPGFYEQTYNGTFLIFRPFTGRATLKTDYRDRIRSYAAMYQPMNYFDLPAVYHGLVSRSLLQKLRDDTGKILDSTSLDIYCVIAFSKYISEYLHVDFPFTLKGGSVKSNSQRLYTGKAKEHFKEFRNFSLPPFLPKVITVETTVVDAFIAACRNTKMEELIQLIDLPSLYARIAIAEPLSYGECREKLKEYAAGLHNRLRFQYIHFTEKRRPKWKIKKQAFLDSLKHVPFLLKAYRKLVPIRNVIEIYQADTIAIGLQIHDRYISEKRIQLSFSEEKPAPASKSPDHS